MPPIKKNLFFTWIFLIFSITFQFVFIPTAATAFANSTLKPLFAPAPGISINLPGNVLIGDDFSFSVTFDNTSLVDVGFGPYMDVFIPQSGVDDSASAEKEDGITYTSVDYLGNAIRTWDGVCAENGTFTHPLTNLDVTCPGLPAGMTSPFTWQYLIVELPFGSFAPDQPPASITIGAQLSDFSDLDQALPIYAQAGFRFGADSLDNPSTDPAIIGPRISAATTPKLFILDKQYLWREDETSTGPNYPRQYLITVNIPDGQTVTNLVLTDLIPENMQYVSIDSTSPATTSCNAPLTTTPGGTLSCTFASVVGTDADVDASITFSFFIPLIDAASARVIDPLTGGCVLSQNAISASADWDPLDPRDTTQSISDTINPAHELEDCSHTIQKFEEIQTDISPVSYSPNDVIEYRLEFQISDFYAEDAFLIIDTISDGQRFDDSFTPTLSIEGNTYSLPDAVFNDANYLVSPDYTPADPAPNTGQTTIAYYVSNEIITRGQPNGYLIGGCVPTTGTAGSDPDCGTYNNGPTTGIIHYRAIIQEAFSDDYPSGDVSVDQGDQLTNSVIASGTILNNSDLSSTGNVAVEDSAASYVIGYGVLNKSIYAVNGSTTFDTPVLLSPNQTITYRITYLLNTSDFEDLEINDYLPLPVLDADELTVFDDVVSGTLPLAGHIKFGPSDTFRAYSGIVPVINVDSVNNSFQLQYGDFDSDLNESKIIDLLFTVTVSADPFADELYLTNQSRVYEGSTNYDESDETSLIQFKLLEPVLRITKGAVSSNRADAAFSPSSVAPVAFSAPGSACPRIAGLINSVNLLKTPIISDISNVDSADLVSFSIIVENTGHENAFDVQVRDDLPVGFAVPVGGINLCVTNGAGSPLAYTDLGGGLLGTGIELVDSGDGILLAGQTEADELVVTGENIAVITFDLELASTVEPDQIITNTAVLFNYAVVEGGPDFTTEDPFDQANATVRLPSADKVFTNSNYAHTGTNEVTIGESATYTLTVTIPEGVTPNAVVTDDLPAGLAFVDCLSVVPSSADLTTDLVGGFAAACNDPTNPTVQNNGDLVQFTLGNLTNANTNNIVDETLVFTFSAVALNIIENQDGVTLINNAVFTWDNGSITSTSADVIIVEPPVDVDKTASPTTGDAGDTVTYTITITNPVSGIDAFNVTLDDIVPAEITYLAGSFSNTSGLAPDTIAEVPDLNAYWGVFPAGSTSVFQFIGDIKTSVTPGDVIYNDAIVKFTSLPDEPGQQSTYNTISYERTGNTSDPGTIANDYTVNDPATVTINIPTPIKYLITTSESHTSGTSVSIGEIVRYRISTIIPEGTSTTFQVRDLLPVGLLYINDGSARLALISNGVGITSSTITCANDTGAAGDPAGIDTSLVDCEFPAGSVTNAGTANLFARGNDPWFDLGNLVNADDDDDREYAVIEFNALVVNITGNQAGTALINDFDVFEGGSRIVNAQNLTVTVVEPNISLAKSVSAGPYDAGDTITYTMVISNSSAANTTTAFDLVFADTFDAALQVQSHTVSVPLYATAVDTSAGNVINVAIDQLESGDSATITVVALIPNDAPAFLDIPNDANVTYTSLPDANGTIPNPTTSVNSGTPGTETGERTGADGVGGTLNDHAAQDDADITLSQPAIDKQDADPTIYTIGELVTFPIVVSLPEGTTRDLIVRDNIPVGLAYVSSQVITDAVSSGGRITLDYSGSALSPTITSAGGSGDDVSFDFGDVLTTADAGSPDNNRFLIMVTTRVLNIPANSGGDTLDNGASLEYTNPNTSATDTITDMPVSISLIEPVMEITKTFNPDQAAINETVQVTLVVSNTGTSPAYDVIIEDPFPTATFQSFSEGTTPVDFTYTTELSGLNTIVRYSGGPIEVGGVRTFIFSTTVGNTFPSGTGFDNTAVVTQATTIDGDNPFERDEPDVTAQDTITAISPDLVVDKDDGQATAVAGEILIYTINVQNVGLHDAAGVVISDDVPADTTFNTANSDPGWSCSDGDPAGTTCTYAIGVLTSTAQVDVLFAVEVNNPAASTTSDITNTASADDNGVYGEDPTLENNSDSDVNTLDTDPLLSVEKTVTFLVDADNDGNPSAGDTLRYTISIENDGDQDASDVVFTDTPDANTDLVVGSVTSSQGIVVAGNTTGDTSISVNLGEIAGAGGTVTVIFSVTISDPLPANTTFVDNQAILSGANFLDVPSDDPDLPGGEDPTITLLNGALIKIVSDTNQTFTTGQDAAIGELIEYEVTLFVPPGETRLSFLTDTLTEGLAFVECISIVPDSGNLTTDLGGGFTEACTNPTVSEIPVLSVQEVDQGRQVEFYLGNLTNTSAEPIRLTLTYQTVVLDSLNNQKGSQVQNEVTWIYEGGSLTATANPIDIIEPDMRITKTANTTTATNNTVITFTLRIGHNALSSADAFELEMTDMLPAKLVYIPGSFIFVSGTIAVVNDTDPTNLTATWDEFPLVGADTILRFQARVTNLSAGQSVANNAYLSWTSLPTSVITAQSVYNTLSTERYYDPPSIVDVYGANSSLVIRAPAPTPVPTIEPTPTYPTSK